MRQTQIKPLIPWIVLFLFIVFGTVILNQTPSEVLFDQKALVQPWFSPAYPPFTSGVVSHHLVGAYMTVLQSFNHLEVDQINLHIRILALVMFAGATFFLGQFVLKKWFLVIALLGVVFVSRFPFLWLSSELFAATFLIFSILSLLHRWPPAIIGTLLVLMAFTKPDMLLLAFFITVIYVSRLLVHKECKRLLVFCSIALVTGMILVLPGVLEQRWSYFNVERRSFFSFAQHYAALVYPHQINQPPPDPWNESEIYMKLFPGCHSVFDVVISQTDRYFGFIALSIQKSLRNIIVTFNFLLILFGVMFWLWKKKKYRLTDFDQIVLVSCVGFVPFILFAYTHIRYLTRYFSLFVVGALCFAHWLTTNKDKEKVPWLAILAWFCVGAFACFHSYWFFSDMGHLGDMWQFYFPD